MPKKKLHILPKKIKSSYIVLATFLVVSGVVGYGVIIGKNNVTNPSAGASPTSRADINNDNVVDIRDVSALLDKWGTNDSTADVDSNGVVAISDLSALLSKWGPVPSVNDPANAGAKFPITYDIATLPGTKRYVATTGNDTTGTGAIGAPYATLAKAISVAVSGDSIVIRGGDYRQGNISIPGSKTLVVTAYPGEIPQFIGSQVFSNGWVTEGTAQYHAYTAQPVTDGSGISFTTGVNLNGDGVGKYPDQAWLGATQLQQVVLKTSLADGKFWVDSANSRIYLTAADVARATVEASSKDVFISVFSPNTKIQGIKVTRFSNSADDYGVIKIYNAADNATIENVEISDSAFMSIMFIGDTDINVGSTLKNSTVTTSNWMGVSANYTDNLTLDGVKITNMNQFDEFSYSPQSGALKTSRTRVTKVLNSDISNNHSHGLWFDQSNVDVELANNQVLDNLGTGVFFEISDDLLMVNNYVRSSGGARAVKLAGSSGLKLVNNTIIGGADPVGVYVDKRSIPGCSDPLHAVCTGGFDSDRDSIRKPLPTTLDWIPRIDLMINNIIAYPTAAGYCSAKTAVCVTASNSPASVPIQTVIHQVDATRGIPKTYIDGNVYANGTGVVFDTAIGSYKTTAAFSTAMAGSPVSISGLEALGLVGDTYVNADGSPTASLDALHTQAVPVPTDAAINQYIAAGTKHFGRQ